LHDSHTTIHTKIADSVPGFYSPQTIRETGLISMSTCCTYQGVVSLVLQRQSRAHLASCKTQSRLLNPSWLPSRSEHWVGGLPGAAPLPSSLTHSLIIPCVPPAHIVLGCQVVCTHWATAAIRVQLGGDLGHTGQRGPTVNAAALVHSKIHPV
jgi:hypothetical protein